MKTIRPQRWKSFASEIMTENDECGEGRQGVREGARVGAQVAVEGRWRGFCSCGAGSGRRERASELIAQTSGAFFFAGLAGEGRRKPRRCRATGTLGVAASGRKHGAAGAKRGRSRSHAGQPPALGRDPPR